MGRIPTIELKNKRSGKIRIWNKSDFDPDRDTDWVVVEERSAMEMAESDSDRGDAPPGPKADKVEVKQDWRDMKWFAARAKVKEMTGVCPKSREHAEELVAEL